MTARSTPTNWRRCRSTWGAVVARLRPSRSSTSPAPWRGAALAFALLLTGGAVAAQPLSRVETGQAAPAFSAPSADGARHALADYAGKVVVLEWTSPVCPYTAQKYRSGAIQALQRSALAEGAVWLSIDTAAPGRPGYLTPAAAKARIARTGARVTAFLFDKDGAIGRLYGAKVTPSFFIVGPGGKLAYQGAMDNEDPRPGQPGANYVSSALSALRAGRPVAVAEAKPYGCAVEY
ncbi:MAG: redoxin domain-containing protein [Caulobacterales bacterium]